MSALPAVSAANTRPQISGTPATSVVVNKSYSFQPTASDKDGDTLTFRISNKPGWASFDKSTGRLSGKPTSTGTFTDIIIRADDGDLNRALPAFSITVKAANRAPTISGSPATSTSTGEVYRFRPTAKDADGDSLGFTIQNKPAWASFSTSTGELKGTPNAAGTFKSIVITASDGKASAALPAFQIKVTVPANRAPTITGVPATAVNGGSAYNFRPTAADADGDTLTYSIANKPSWASFSKSSGRLSGTPAAADAGKYSNIVISVSDGKASVALAAFAVTVNQVSFGGASLSWIAPTENVDGSPLRNLAGYRIYYGTSASALTQTVQVANPSVSTYVLDGLSPATYYFAVRAYTSGGLESANSNVTSKTVR